MPLIFDKNTEQTDSICVHPGMDIGDIDDTAEDMEEWAGHEVTQISRVWKGFRTRREVHNHRILEEYHAKKVLMLQCWWRRSYAIKQKLKLRNEWENARKAKCVEYEKKLITVVQEAVLWQPTTWLCAASTIQDVFRKGRRLCTKHPHHPSKRTIQSARVVLDHAIKEYEKNKLNQYIKDHNAASSPPRKRGVDDHNNNTTTNTRGDAAECIQRAWRVYVAKREINRRRTRAKYFHRRACIVQRAWRRYHAKELLQKYKREWEAGRLEQRRKREEASVLSWDEEFVWRRALFNGAALKLQKFVRTKSHKK
eukprot:PhF_6_TR5604/c0_g1_i1/m.8074